MSSDPGSGRTEGEGDDHGSEEKNEGVAADHGSEENTEVTAGKGSGAGEDDQDCPGPPGSELLRGKRSRVSTEGRKLMVKKAKPEKGKKKSARTNEKASAAGKGSSASPGNSPPPPVRFPPYPKNGTARDVVRWSIKCRKIEKKAKEDPRRNLPTVRNPKDPETTNAVQLPEEKKRIINAARSTVSVSSIGQDGVKIRQCSGIIISERGSKKFVATSSMVVCQMGDLLSPLPKLSIRLGDGDRICLEGKLAFFSYHYDLVLLEIEVSFPVQLASTGTCPLYDQEVYVLSRGKESDLMVRHGKVKCLDESNYIGRDYYMFLDYEIPEEGTGGCVVDPQSKNDLHEIYSTSHILEADAPFVHKSDACRVVRPLLGFSLRSILLLDVQLQDELSSCYNIDTGFIVDNVSYDSAAEGLGIEYGDVIHAFNDEHVQASTLPQLEDYLLSLGQTFLENPESTFELKLRVCSLLRRYGRRITLPITFGDHI
ncbi:hypothetical protein QOZ80_4BG0331220 [Eleusine coracana subsp. coracana]|nr:hypothetical protein QOZ80_4BG0331220 [Eleusine coracana subsp. coracana]